MVLAVSSAPKHAADYVSDTSIALEEESAQVKVEPNKAYDEFMQTLEEGVKAEQVPKALQELEELPAAQYEKALQALIGRVQADARPEVGVPRPLPGLPDNTPPIRALPIPMPPSRVHLTPAQERLFAQLKQLPQIQAALVNFIRAHPKPRDLYNLTQIMRSAVAQESRMPESMRLTQAEMIEGAVASINKYNQGLTIINKGTQDSLAQRAKVNQFNKLMRFLQAAELRMIDKGNFQAEKKRATKIADSYLGIIRCPGFATQVNKLMNLPDGRLQAGRNSGQTNKAYILAGMQQITAMSIYKNAQPAQQKALLQKYLTYTTHSQIFLAASPAIKKAILINWLPRVKV